MNFLTRKLYAVSLRLPCVKTYDIYVFIGLYCAHEPESAEVSEQWKRSQPTSLLVDDTASWRSVSFLVYVVFTENSSWWYTITHCELISDLTSDNRTTDLLSTTFKREWHHGEVNRRDGRGSYTDVWLLHRDKTNRATRLPIFLYVAVGKRSCDQPGVTNYYLRDTDTWKNTWKIIRWFSENVESIFLPLACMGWYVIKL